MPKQYTVHTRGGTTTSLSGHTSADMIFYTKAEAEKYARNWRKKGKNRYATISVKTISKSDSDYQRYLRYKKRK